MSLLTGPEIEYAVDEGLITIDPFVKENVGPNSVDLRLADDIRRYALKSTYIDSRARTPNMRRLATHNGGYRLTPGKLYLARTVETVGSDHYVPTIEGRSSMGRLGVQVHMTAGIGDMGFHGTFTLEIHVTHPVILYPGQRVAQVLFWTTQGARRLYQGRYQNQVNPVESRGYIEGYTPRDGKIND